VPTIHSPSLELFEPFFRHAKPVVIKGITTNWQAQALWRDLEALKSRMGGRPVPVEIGENYMHPSLVKNSVAFDLFLHYLQLRESKEAESSDAVVYLAQTPLAELSLQNDVQIPDLCKLTGRGDIYASNAWIGPAGTVSSCHTDPYHNLLVQVYVHKHILCMYILSATVALITDSFVFVDQDCLYILLLLVDVSGCRQEACEATQSIIFR
jgi:Cupin-like domain